MSVKKSSNYRAEMDNFSKLVDRCSHERGDNDCKTCKIESKCRAICDEAIEFSGSPSRIINSWQHLRMASCK